MSKVEIYDMRVVVDYRQEPYTSLDGSAHSTSAELAIVSRATNAIH